MKDKCNRGEISERSREMRSWARPREGCQTRDNALCAEYDCTMCRDCPMGQIELHYVPRLPYGPNWIAPCAGNALCARAVVNWPVACSVPTWSMGDIETSGSVPHINHINQSRQSHFSFPLFPSVVNNSENYQCQEINMRWNNRGVNMRWKYWVESILIMPAVVSQFKVSLLALLISLHSA